jgi:hypothetical protein
MSKDVGPAREPIPGADPIHPRPTSQLAVRHVGLFRELDGMAADRPPSSRTTYRTFPERLSILSILAVSAAG